MPESAFERAPTTAETVEKEMIIVEMNDKTAEIMKLKIIDLQPDSLEIPMSAKI